MRHALTFALILAGCTSGPEDKKSSGKDSTDETTDEQAVLEGSKTDPNAPPTAIGAFEVTAPKGAAFEKAPTVKWSKSEHALAYDVVVDDDKDLPCREPLQDHKYVEALEEKLDELAGAGDYYLCLWARGLGDQVLPATGNPAKFTVVLAKPAVAPKSVTLASGKLTVVPPDDALTVETYELWWGDASGAVLAGQDEAAASVARDDVSTLAVPAEKPAGAKTVLVAAANRHGRGPFTSAPLD